MTVNCKKTILLVGVIFLLLFCFRKRENFTEIFGMAGYKPSITEVNINYNAGIDTSNYKRNIGYAVGPNDTSMCAEKTSQFIKQQTDLCNRIIETNLFEVFTNPDNNTVLFKCRLMAMITSANFPFGLSVDVEILDGQVIKGTSQPLGPTNNKITPFTGDDDNNFLPAIEIIKPNLK
jgi:hypothetical protein